MFETRLYSPPGERIILVIGQEDGEACLNEQLPALFRYQIGGFQNFPPDVRFPGNIVCDAFSRKGESRATFDVYPFTLHPLQLLFRVILAGCIRSSCFSGLSLQDASNRTQEKIAKNLLVRFIFLILSC